MRHIVLLAMVAACGGEKAPDPRGALLASWGEHVIMPTYRSFESEAQALAEHSRSLCEAPSPDTRGVAQEAWHAARSPWKQMEVFAFGPYREEPHRLAPKIDFWPVRVEAIGEILEGEQDISADTLGATQRGLPVIEYLLFRPERLDDRGCEYLLAVAADLAANATAMRHAWDPLGENFLGEFQQPASFFASRHDVLSEVVNRMGFLLENIRADKLSKADALESPFSGRAVEDIRDNLRGIELLYFGTGAASSLGMASFDKHADDMRTGLVAVREALDAIPAPLESAFADDPAALEDARTKLTDLQRLVQVDITGSLGLTQRFNDNDGD